MYIEIKGVLDRADRRKMNAVRKAHPSLDIRFWFMRANNKCPGTKNMKHWEWAEKNGFPNWCEGDRLPRTWIREIDKS